MLSALGPPDESSGGPLSNAPSPARLILMYRQMVLIRLFEQKMIEMFSARAKRGGASLNGALHSSEGQEAVAVGVCSAMDPGDYLFSTYRGHGHAIARGLDVKRVTAELHGKATGVSGGFGGSMHLFAPELGFMGGNGIVAGGLPLALGTAFASAYRHDGRVTVAFFGDGGSAQGAFHESLNMASIMKWPLVFVCENNQYAATTHVSLNCPLDDVADRSIAYGMPGVVVDGNDPVAVAGATDDALRRARHGEGPTLLECKTYRDRPHSMGVVESRPSRERSSWKEQDPIKRMGERLIAQDLVAGTEALSDIWSEQERALAEAIEFMEASPEPDPATMADAMWAPAPQVAAEPLAGEQS